MIIPSKQVSDIEIIFNDEKSARQIFVDRVISATTALNERVTQHEDISDALIAFGASVLAANLGKKGGVDYTSYSNGIDYDSLFTGVMDFIYEKLMDHISSSDIFADDVNLVNGSDDPLGADDNEDGDDLLAERIDVYLDKSTTAEARLYRLARFLKNDQYYAFNT